MRWHDIFLFLSILLISIVPPVHAGSSLYPISSYGTIDYPEEIFFQSGFETGDLSDFYIVVRGPRHEDICLAEITKDLAHTGEYSAKLTLVNPSGPDTQRIELWTPQHHGIWQKEYIVSGWVYFPASFGLPVDDPEGYKGWVNLMVQREDKYPESGQEWEYPYFIWAQWGVGAYEMDEKLFLSFTRNSNMPAIQTTITKDTNYEITRERWIHLQIYFLRDYSNGKIIVWVDGEEVLKLEGIRTIGPTYDMEEAVMYNAWKLYTNWNQQPNYLYWDDCIVSSS